MRSVKRKLLVLAGILALPMTPAWAQRPAAEVPA